MSLEVLAVDFDFLGSLEFADEVSRHLQASETFSVSCFRVQTEVHLGLDGTGRINRKPLQGHWVDRGSKRELL